MTTTTLDIYDLLVNAGIDAEKAKPLAKEILSRSEAREVLATKQDMADLKVWVAGMLLAQAALVVTLQQLLG